MKKKKKQLAGTSIAVWWRHIYCRLPCWLTGRKVLHQRNTRNATATEKCVEIKQDFLKNKLHGVTFPENIFESLWTFQLALLCMSLETPGAFLNKLLPFFRCTFGSWSNLFIVITFQPFGVFLFILFSFVASVMNWSLRIRRNFYRMSSFKTVQLVRSDTYHFFWNYIIKFVFGFLKTTRMLK